MTRCKHSHRVPLDLVQEAWEKSTTEHVDMAVQCQLSSHDDGEHYGLFSDTGEYGTATWLRWRERTEAELIALPDCPVVATGPDGEACCLFDGHAEHHTWEAALEEVSCSD